MSSQENIEQVLMDENTNMNVNMNVMPTEEETNETPPPPYMQSCFLGVLGSWKTEELLNDTNWVAWKGQMTSMLRVNKVWGHCDRTIVPPEVNEPCAFDKWATTEEVTNKVVNLRESQGRAIHPYRTGRNGQADVG